MDHTYRDHHGVWWQTTTYNKPRSRWPYAIGAGILIIIGLIALLIARFPR